MKVQLNSIKLRISFTDSESSINDYGDHKKVLLNSFQFLGQCLGFDPQNPIINNGNRTEWSPIRSVIIRVINKIGQPHSGNPICLITSMITDRIGQHEVLLPFNQIYNKIRERKGRKRTREGIDNSF